MSIYHKAILDGLPAATRETKTTKAYLFEYDQSASRGQYLWAFLYNPSTLEFERSAKYSEAQTLSAQKSNWQYGYTSGRSLSISDIVLDAWCQGKSIQPLLDGIEALLEADIAKNKYNPTILSFVWGSRRFGPCVLSQVQWKEDGWLGGTPARATMSLRLLEVPDPLTSSRANAKKQQSANNKADTRQKAGMPRLPLTERQAIAASAKAKEILQKNVSRFSPQVQALVKSSSYKLSTNRNTGDVVMIDRKGAKVGIMGRYDGLVLAVTGVSTLLKK